MSTSDTYLIVRHDPTNQQEFPLSEQTISIGREAFNDLILYDPEVSRRHVQISFQSGRHIVEDAGSTNGTFVNGRRIKSPTPLNDGDVIEVGEGVSMTYRGEAYDGLETRVEPPPVPDYVPPAIKSPPPMGSGQSDVPETEVWDGPVAPGGLPPTEVWSGPIAPGEGPAAVPPTEVWSGPVAPGATPEVPAYDLEDEESDTTRIALGVGCLLILTVIICAATVFILDAVAPDALYCGPFQPIFRLLGFDLICP